MAPKRTRGLGVFLQMQLLMMLPFYVSFLGEQPGSRLIQLISRARSKLNETATSRGKHVNKRQPVIINKEGFICSPFQKRKKTC